MRLLGPESAPGRVLALLLACIFFGCSHAVPELARDSDYRRGRAAEEAESLRASVAAVAAGGGNLGRLEAIRHRASELGLGPLASTEPIDWFSFQKNLVIEIPGASDRIIYIVAHYDKADLNPLKVGSILLNGVLDELIAWTFLSEGATDNATGVAVALELARSLHERRPTHTYRVLLSGSEESGVRGARTHVSRMDPGEREAIALAINIDTVGLKFAPNCVSENVTDDRLLEDVLGAADRLKMSLGRDRLPFIAASDYAPFKATSFWRDLFFGLKFNVLGGLLPQRSWFTGHLATPVINFSACDLVSDSDYLAATVLLPLGRVHGPRDRRSQVSIERLYEQYAIIREFLSKFDDGHAAR